MGAPTLKTLAAERVITELLAAGPKTAQELSRAMHLQVLERWAAEELEMEVDWFTKAEPFGARLLAHVWGVQQGYVWLHAYELHNRLASMEKRGLVMRVQVVGHRPMLWRLP